MASSSNSIMAGILILLTQAKTFSLVTFPSKRFLGSSNFLNKTTSPFLAYSPLTKAASVTWAKLTLSISKAAALTALKTSVISDSV